MAAELPVTMLWWPIEYNQPAARETTEITNAVVDLFDYNVGVETPDNMGMGVPCHGS